jgi:hypothetical protein
MKQATDTMHHTFVAVDPSKGKLKEKDSKAEEKKERTQPIYACKMCRLHHKKCNGRPCTRCVQKGYTCEKFVKSKSLESNHMSILDKMYAVLQKRHAELVCISNYESASKNPSDPSVPKTALRFILN